MNSETRSSFFLVIQMQRMTLLKSILTAGALALCVQMASATTMAPQTLVLTGSSSPATSLNFTDGALGLTVTARQWDTFTSNDADEERGLNAVNAAHPDKVTQSANGLGETRGTKIDPASGNNPPGNSTAVNSGSYTVGNVTTTYREALLFTFTKQVRILSVTFFVPGSSAVDAFLFDGDPVTATQGSDLFTLAATSANSNRSLGFSTDFSTQFAFGAKAGYANRFFIKSIEVQVIPLPAGGILLASALVVPFLRRKRRAA